MTTIIGVDYSGAKTDNATWKTEAVMRGGTFEIILCSRIKRKPLTEFLEGLQDNDAVVGLDFPFSVPQAFAKELDPVARSMPEVWKAVDGIGGYNVFDNKRQDFVKRHGEIARSGDAHFGGPFSPLKLVNPNMLPMTFQGMKLLSRLWDSSKGFRVPPLPDNCRNGPTLLETMPGVLLRSFGLPARNYKTKNKTNDGHPENVRREILQGLLEKTQSILQLQLQMPSAEKQKCLDNADCLDSLVASIGAVMWLSSDPKSMLHRPEDHHDQNVLLAARLEGWIYAPNCPLSEVPAK